MSVGARKTFLNVNFFGTQHFLFGKLLVNNKYQDKTNVNFTYIYYYILIIISKEYV